MPSSRAKPSGRGVMPLSGHRKSAARHAQRSDPERAPPSASNAIKRIKLMQNRASGAESRCAAHLADDLMRILGTAESEEALARIRIGGQAMRGTILYEAERIARRSAAAAQDALRAA